MKIKEGNMIKSPIKAIRAKCLDCSYDNYAEVKRCQVPECILYPFRFGKNPYSKKKLSSEHLRKLQAGRKKSTQRVS